MATSGVTTNQERTATPATIAGTSAASAEGTALSVARSDHTHATNYTDPASGGAARTFAAKFGDIKHVKDFGAVCDGVTNDGTAIQNAVNAAGTGIVLIPSNCVGTYTNAGGALIFDMRSALLDLGTAYGLKAINFRSRTANPSASGQVRLAVSDTIGFRNNANTGDLSLGINGSDQLTFNGAAIGSGSTASALTSASVSPATTGVVRLANVDGIYWRNVGNTADLGLTVNGANRLLYNGNLVTGNAQCEATTAAGQSIPNATDTAVVFGTTVRDTDALYNNATGQFTVSSGTFGDYGIWGCIAFNGALTATVTCSIFKNGVALKTVCRVNPAAGETLLVSCNTYLLGADVITISVNQNSGGAAVLKSDAARNYFCMKHGAF